MFTHFIFIVTVVFVKDFAVEYFPTFAKDLVKAFVVEVIVKRIFK